MDKFETSLAEKATRDRIAMKSPEKKIVRGPIKLGVKYQPNLQPNYSCSYETLVYDTNFENIGLQHTKLELR